MTEIKFFQKTYINHMIFIEFIGFLSVIIRFKDIYIDLFFIYHYYFILITSFFKSIYISLNLIITLKNL